MDYPFIEECLTDYQATRYFLLTPLTPRMIQYLSVYGFLTPVLDSMKNVLDEDDNQLGTQLTPSILPSPHSETEPHDQKQYEESLHTIGRSILAKCRRIASLICSCQESVSTSQKIVLYVLLLSSPHA